MLRPVSCLQSFELRVKNGMEWRSLNDYADAATLPRFRSEQLLGICVTSGANPAAVAARMQVRVVLSCRVRVCCVVLCGGPKHAVALCYACPSLCNTLPSILLPRVTGGGTTTLEC